MAKPKKFKDLQRARAKARNRRGIEAAEKRRAAGKTELYPPGRRYNGYQCDPKGGCGGIYLTVDLDPGVTPMFMPCLITPDCEGLAVSLGYPRALPPAKLPLLLEWYAPDPLYTLPADIEEHVRKGGLVRRPTDEAPEWVKEKIGPHVPRMNETQPTQLSIIYGDHDGESTAQEPSDHLHLAGGAGSSGQAADPSDSGQGEAVEEVRGVEQDPRQ
jgi:hypothetical protein